MIRAYLRTFLRRRLREITALCLWSLVEAVPSFVLGRAVASSIDAFLKRDGATGMMWFGVLAVAAVAGAIGTRCVYPRLARLTEPLRDDLVGIVVTSALRRASRSGHRDTGALGRLTLQVEIVRDTFAGLVLTARGIVFSAGAALLGLFTLVPEVIPLVLPPLLLGLVLFAVLLRALVRRQRAFVTTGEELTEELTATAEGMRDIVACGGEDRVHRRGLDGIGGQEGAALALARMNGVRALVIALAGWGPVLAVLAASPALLGRGLTAGTIAGALTYLVQGLQPAVQTLSGALGGGMMRLIVVLGRILEHREPPPGPAAPALVRPVRRDLRLRGVSFSYGGRGKPIVEGLDLTIEEGARLAVVGPSGSGKTTLAGLLSGLLTPASGEVLLSGIPINALSGLPAYRTLVPQEPYVFQGTVRENLAYLRPSVRLGAITEAVGLFGLDHVVSRCGGLDGELDPAALSAGERQLIVLGRAYLAAAGIVILDEATCHLDSVAALAAEDAFAGRTLVVIAHRMNSALRAGRTLVMDGADTMIGTSVQLAQRSPLFRNLLGHWSEPAGLLGDPDGVDAIARPRLADDPGEMISDRSGGQA